MSYPVTNDGLAASFYDATVIHIYGNGEISLTIRSNCRHSSAFEDVC